MGQYYKTVNVTKQQTIKNRGNIKLTEGTFVKHHQKGGDIVGLLLDESSSKILSEKYPKFPFGIWNNDVVIHAGDYYDEQDFVPEQYKGKHNLYNLADDIFSKPENYNSRSYLNRTLINKNLFLLNYSKKEFVSLRNYLSQYFKQDEYSDICNPLILLIAAGNQRGSGDFYGNDEEMVGSWIGDQIGTSITVTKEELQDWTEIKLYFVEGS